MSRFFVPSRNVIYEGETAVSIEIVGTDVNHIKNVLRKCEGDGILLCDSKGLEYDCEIIEISQERIAARVINVSDVNSEPSVPVFLLQGVPKGDKMDFIVQKGVELGLSGVLPVVTERTVVKFGSLQDREKKKTRWQRISLEAAKQCGRGAVPDVLVPEDFSVAVKTAGEGIFANYLKLIPYENETSVTLKEMLLKHKESLLSGAKGGEGLDGILIFIGPEGGFSQKEVDRAGEAGFLSVTLGKRILRTETAGLATVAAIRYELED